MRAHTGGQVSKPRRVSGKEEEWAVLCRTTRFSTEEKNRARAVCSCPTDCGFVPVANEAEPRMLWSGGLSRSIEAFFSKGPPSVFAGVQGQRCYPVEKGRAGSAIDPFRTAVPLWGQSIQFLSSVSPKRDCSPINKRVNRHIPGTCTCGHMLLLSRLTELARARGGIQWAFVFMPHGQRPTMLLVLRLAVSC